MINPNKLLFEFDFQFSHYYDFTSLISENLIWSRSILENIFVAANASYVRVEQACGTVNPVYLES